MTDALLAFLFVMSGIAILVSRSRAAMAPLPLPVYVIPRRAAFAADLRLAPAS